MRNMRMQKHYWSLQLNNWKKVKTKINYFKINYLNLKSSMLNLNKNTKDF